MTGCVIVFSIASFIGWVTVEVLFNVNLGIRYGKIGYGKGVRRIAVRSHRLISKIGALPVNFQIKLPPFGGNNVTCRFAGVFKQGRPPLP